MAKHILPTVAALALAAALSASPVLAEDLVFTLVNNSSHSIVEMYVSSVDDENWGENILMVDAVDPGALAWYTHAADLPAVLDFGFARAAIDAWAAELPQA